MILRDTSTTLASVLALGSASVALGADVIDWTNLPWEDLQDRLSSSATLILSDVASQAAAYADECYPEFKQPRASRVAQKLAWEPSGLCMNQLACIFEQCSPLDAQTTTIDERLEILIGGIDEPYTGKDLPWDQGQWGGYLQADNPFWNVPSYVLFPVTAGDVVAAVNFAKEYGLEISVKTSGNSYSGASTKKDTLHLNMNKKFPAYSSNGIIDCEVFAERSSLMNEPFHISQPCSLAAARGKQGFIRVGGGEQFQTTYQSVHAFNEENKALYGGYKYRLVGGAAGTVSPMGWTFQGGLASTTGGRMLGTGVDQVLQIEMVLPSGKHVRFGPTEWEDAEGYLYPKTTKVSGVCNRNPEVEDEASWDWKECDEDINFDDLWFAMRGGLGGTWGVVLSLALQLHDSPPMEVVTKNPDCKAGVDVYELAKNSFVISFMLNPSAVGVTVEQSKLCQGFRGDNIFCYGELSAEPFLSAWEEYVKNMDQNLSGCLHLKGSYADYASLVTFEKGPNQGLVLSFPYPSYLSTNEGEINLLVPAKYYVENPDAANIYKPAYLAFGGNLNVTTDQNDALSAAHRTAGNMIGMPIEHFDESFWSETFPKMFDTSDPTNFPGFVGSNHAGPNTRGPLKEDWTKPCPLQWTPEERDEKCISVQESIYGTKLLRRLEKIKEQVDPNYMFNCYGCVGNNKKKDASIAGSVFEAASLRGGDAIDI